MYDDGLDLYNGFGLTIIVTAKVQPECNSDGLFGVTIKSYELFDELSDCQLLNKESARCSYLILGS
jgi:hypothetical protein